MSRWDYHNPSFFEIRYEKIIKNEGSIFASLFRHYGFSESIVKRGCRIAKDMTFSAVSKRRLGEIQEHSHLRSGLPGQWKRYFKAVHKKRFKELYPGLLIQLGYEKNDKW